MSGLGRVGRVGVASAPDELGRNNKMRERDRRDEGQRCRAVSLQVELFSFIHLHNLYFDVVFFF